MEEIQQKNWTCEYCKKEIIYKGPSTISGHLHSCKDWKLKKKEIAAKITKDFLIQEHITKGKTVSCIAQELQLRKNTIVIKKCKEFNIAIQRINNPCQKLFMLEKSKQTNRLKYGADYHLSTKKSKDKIKQTNLRKYGKENVFQVEEFQDKVKKTNLRKYGKENVFQVEEFKKKLQHTQFLRSSKRFYSSLLANECFYLIYEKLPEELKNKTYFKKLNKEFGKYGNKKYNYYDFVISSIKFCIEFNGDYWHANPRIYSENQVIAFPNGIKKISKELWERDKLKNDLLINDGFNIEIVWEDTYRDNKEKIIEDIIEKIKNRVLEFSPGGK